MMSPWHPGRQDVDRVIAFCAHIGAGVHTPQPSLSLFTALATTSSSRATAAAAAANALCVRCACARPITSPHRASPFICRAPPQSIAAALTSDCPANTGTDARRRFPSPTPLHRLAAAHTRQPSSC